VLSLLEKETLRVAKPQQAVVGLGRKVINQGDWIRSGRKESDGLGPNVVSRQSPSPNCGKGETRRASRTVWHYSPVAKDEVLLAWHACMESHKHVAQYSRGMSPIAVRRLKSPKTRLGLWSTSFFDGGQQHGKIFAP
jgi:hypothetical protein